MKYLNESISFVLSRWPDNKEMSLEEIREFIMKTTGMSLKPDDYQKIVNQAVTQGLLELTEEAKYKKINESKAQP